MCVLSGFGRCHNAVVLNLSWFVAPFQRLPTLVAPYSSIEFCNITAELFSKGLCSWSPGNRSVVPNGCRGLRLWNPQKAFARQKTRPKLFWYYYKVTLFMIFSWLLLRNIFHVCYCATIQWLLLFCYMSTVRQLSSPASDRLIAATT